MSRFTPSGILGIQRAGCGQADADEEEGEDVEQSDPEDDLLRRSWDFLSGVLGLCCGQAREFSAVVGKGCSNENAAETLEAVQEGRVRRMPSFNSQ